MSMFGTVELIGRLLRGASERRALIVGDCMLDRYIHGEVVRISPEAPVPIVSALRHSTSLGGAANVAAGVRALGLMTTLVGLVGPDESGREMIDLAQLSDLEARIQVGNAGTITKTRIVTGARQLIRLDEDGDHERRERDAVDQLAECCNDIGEFDVVILSDYDKGTLPVALVRRLLKNCQDAGVPTVVDPKKSDFEVYAGAKVLTPNRLELERATGRPYQSAQSLLEAAPLWCSTWGVGHLLCTRGADGMVLTLGDRVCEIAADVRHVADITGAGDTVVAVLAAALAVGGDVESAVHLASVGAGAAVSRPGVYVVNRTELDCAVTRKSPKLVSQIQAIAIREQWRREGLKVVFTNGCFDVLHAGHLECLEGARRLGDKLIVAVNSDASVRRLKGPTRPRNALPNRMALLSGLSCIDLIVSFDQDTPADVIGDLRPDILAKGGDYKLSELAGADIVRNYGGEVVLLPYVVGLSSSKILAE